MLSCQVLGTAKLKGFTVYCKLLYCTYGIYFVKYHMKMLQRVALAL